MNKKGMLVVLSAPSGCGKDTIFRAVRDKRNDCVESVSATTRAPREGEINGENYFFKTTEEFEEMIKNHELLEYTNYNSKYYGTPVAGVEKAIEEGKVCFLIIEVEGAQNIMKLRPEAVSIFILPPSIDELKRRLIKRGTENMDAINRRVAIAEGELQNASKYKYNVVNDDLDVAVNDVIDIINKELDARN